jgi:2-desacetyl-2-hydroxyethyl bacteriochlorophyllide A dehydrogenase
VLALTSDAPGSLRLEEIPEPEAGPGEVVVRIDEVGICGTDLKIVSGALAVDHPVILGHELVGRVHAIGPGITVAPGQRVLVNPATWCGRCRLCRAGRTNLCEFAGRMGMDIPGGGLAKLAVVEERLHLLSEDVSRSTAVLLQVLGTCVHAQRLVELFPGQRAAVIGLGVSGLMHVQLLRARGLEVVAVGRSPAKLELARQMGASAAADIVEAGRWGSEGSRGFDVVVEAAGTAESFALASDLVSRGGILLVFGIHDGHERPVAFRDFYVKELRIANARGATALDYDQCIELVSMGVIDLSAIRIERYPLERAREAFEAAKQAKDVVKFVLEP